VIIPKQTRSMIFKADREVEILWPDQAREPQVGHTYSVQTKGGPEGTTGLRLLVSARRQDEEQLWHATVKLDGDPTRLLGRGGGYRSSEMGAMSVDPDHPNYEPEAVSKEEEQRLADEAAVRFNQGRVSYQAERERKPLIKRLQEVVEEANRRKVNVSSQVRSIERQVQAMERLLYDREA
jgi:hypothetical protein